MFLKILQNLHESTRVSFLIKLLAALKKGDSSTGVFFWVFQNFKEHLGTSTSG